MLFSSELHVTKFSYRRYVEHTFLLFSSELHVTKFLNYVNSKHRNIKVTVEREENNSLSLLNINIFRHSGKFQTAVYRKPTFRDVLTNIDNFLPILYKYNLVCTLLQRQGRIYWGGGAVGPGTSPINFLIFVLENVTKLVLYFTFVAISICPGTNHGRFMSSHLTTLLFSLVFTLVLI